MNKLIEEQLEKGLFEEGILDFIKGIGKKFSTAVLGLGKSESDALEDFEKIVKRADDKTKQQIKDKLDSLQNNNIERQIKDVFGRIDDRFKNMSVNDIDRYIDNLNNILGKYSAPSQNQQQPQQSVQTQPQPTQQTQSQQPKAQPAQQQSVQQTQTQQQEKPKIKSIKPDSAKLEQFEVIFDKIRPGLRTLSDYNKRVKDLKERLKIQLNSTEFKKVSDLISNLNPGDKINLKSIKDTTQFIENGDSIVSTVDSNGNKQVIFIPKGMSGSPINLIQ